VEATREKSEKTREARRDFSRGAKSPASRESKFCVCLGEETRITAVDVVAVPRS